MGKKNPIFLVWFMYGDLERGVAFWQRFYTETARDRKVRSVDRRLGSMRGKYAGNMHADQSHLDYEIYKFDNPAAFDGWLRRSRMELSDTPNELKEVDTDG